ncbi:MAG: glutathione S-transferase family protein [Alphaproteobacteria bacterium]|nr:glutathione S-transferase family protein [Alphaproteobacteria bacterium]MDP6830139.1 glutathione S-transferase family protein [Alphaproteobacteria bacterium]MDP6876614.1 glutathione S-transferase family protein [Alphaproteobacteria bacterium]
MPPYRLIIGDKNLSSWSLRAWLLMRQFGLPFEEVAIRLDQPDSQSQIGQYSPAGRVPILQCGEQTIWDSLAITEFLAERHPALPIWPRDAAARARARAVAAEMHAGFAAMREELPFDCRTNLPLPALSQAARSDIARIQEIWRTAHRERLGGGVFLFGEFSAADAMFAPVAVRFVQHGVTLDELCRDYAAALFRLPAMEQWLADADAEVKQLSG